MASKRQRLLSALIVTALVLMFVRAAFLNVADVDIWHQMSLAREILARGSVPWRDDFAYTDTVFPVVHHEWAAGLIAYCLMSALGGKGIVLAHYALACALAGLCWLGVYRKGVSLAVLSFTAPVAMVLASSGFATLRAQMYSYVLAACLLYWIDRERGRSRLGALPWVLVLFACWVNLHAGFVYGAVLLGALWLEHLARKEPHLHLLSAGAALIPLIALNPWGTHYYGYLWRALTMPRPLVEEWAPLWVPGHSLPVYCVQVGLFVLSLGAVGYAVRAAGVTRCFGLAGVLVAAACAVRVNRVLPFYAIVWFWYVPAWLDSTPLGRAMNTVYRSLFGLLTCVWGLAVVALVIGFGVRYRSWEPKLIVFDSELAKVRNCNMYPVGAVRFLADNGFAGNVMTHFNWGAYVSWRLYPAVKVSLDSRYEAAYTSAWADRNTAFYSAKSGWESTLTAYPTDAVILEKSCAVAAKMPRARGWRKVYEDDFFQVYAREPSRLPVRDCRGQRIVEEVP
jgi:hypothetical protein